MPSKIPIHFVDDDSPVEQSGSPTTSLASAPDLATADDFDQAGENYSLGTAWLSADGPRFNADATATLGAEDGKTTPHALTIDANEEASVHEFDAEAFDEEVVVNDEPADVQAIATRLERVEVELSMVDAERQELTEKIARVQADFDNFRKRTEREKERTYQGVVSDIARNLLPVLDNLQRAVEAETSVRANESKEFRHFVHGVELIHRQLRDVLENLGLKPVQAIGLPFDPYVHEAVATEYSAQHEPETVLQEMVKGYRLGEVLLRPAMVKVSTK